MQYYTGYQILFTVTGVSVDPGVVLWSLTLCRSQRSHACGISRTYYTFIQVITELRNVIKN